MKPRFGLVWAVLSLTYLLVMVLDGPMSLRASLLVATGVASLLLGRYGYLAAGIKQPSHEVWTTRNWLTLVWVSLGAGALQLLNTL